MNFLNTYKNKKWFILIEDMLKRFKNHRLKASSAEIAYFILLSIFPFFMVLLNLFSRFSITNPEMISEVVKLLPVELQPLIKTILLDFQIGFGSDLQLIVVVVLGIYSTSLGIQPIINSCNLAFNEEDKRSGLKLIIISLVYIISFITLIFILLITRVVGEQIFNFIYDYFKLPKFISNIWYFVKNIIAPIMIITVLYLLNCYSLSKELRKKVGFWGFLPGTILSAVLMMILSFIFSIRSNSYTLTYGSISNVIMLIIWLYSMGTSLIIGFELNGALYEMRNKIQEDIVVK